MEFDLDKLKQEEESAKREKGIYGALGAITQGFDSVPTANELLYGGKSYRPNNKAIFDNLAAGVEDPLAKRKKEFESEKMASEVGRTNSSRDANSREAVMARAWLKKNGYDIADTDSLEKIESIYGKVPDLVREELKSRGDFERQKQLRQMDISANAYQKKLDRDNALALKGLEQDQKRLDANKANTKNLQEFSSRHDNIKNSLKDLDAMIVRDGTHDWTGAHNSLLEQKLDAIAIDAAKLFDPESVARESEVAAFKKMLFEPGLMTKNKTARDTLTGFKNMLESRAAVAKKNFGPQVDPRDEAKEAISWAMQNPNDPRSAKILQTMGVNVKAPPTAVGKR